ncbi:MAG: SpoIIE family protein phosphatase [Gallionella sp.]
MRINLPVSQVERRVPSGEVLVSKTDLNGSITYCNRIFSEFSGFKEGEMIGAPHNIIRHPDMPSFIYADCWQCIQADKPWHGIIKNRCKNGDYYWVKANITPLLENGVKVGYVSLRFKASEAQIAEAIISYEAIRNGKPATQISRNSDFSYIVELQQTLANKIMALEASRNRNEEELRLGNEIMMRINSSKERVDDCVKQKIIPAAQYSGDILLVQRTPADVLHVLLADAVGHGLIAAINVLPLSQTFNRMSIMGYDISSIVEELNLNIYEFTPANRFVAATLISIDWHHQLVEVWNGGNPASLLIDADGKILKQWESRNLPLGICNKQIFSSSTEVFNFTEDCQMLLFSDGLSEAESLTGEPFGQDRIRDLLQITAPDKRFDILISAFESHLGGQAAHDDVSLALVTIPLSAEQRWLPQALGSRRLAELESEWHFSISLSADELKYVEVVPLITQIITIIHATRDHQSALFLILSELFNNALDHGVLQLDSKIKQGVEGFEKYLEQRNERLSALKTGCISIEVEKVLIDGEYAVKIRVVDSGKGFDYQAVMANSANQVVPMQYGRGIALMQSLVYKLEYGQRGNEAIAYYVCSALNSKI